MAAFLKFSFFPLLIALSPLLLLGQGQEDIDMLAKGLTLSSQSIATLPRELDLTHEGRIEVNAETGTVVFLGNVTLQGEENTTLKARYLKVSKEDNRVFLKGGIHLRQPARTSPEGIPLAPVEIFADQARIDSQHKTVWLSGDVSIYQGSALHRASRIDYNYQTGKFASQQLASGLGPVILKTSNLQRIEDKGKWIFIAKNAQLTTHDVAQPNYWVTAKKTVIYPQDRVTFRDLKLYVKGVPLFWLPYLAQPLDADLGYHFLPGVKSSWGAYLLNSYGILLGGDKNPATGDYANGWLLSKWRLDLRSKRGVALGLDLANNQRRRNPNLPGFAIYGLYDADPNYNSSSETRIPISPHRWKITYQDKIPLNLWKEKPDSQTLLGFNLHKLSDRYFLEDFEPDTFKSNPEPVNELFALHYTPLWQAGARLRLQMNDFYASQSYLPEVFFQKIKHPFFHTPFLHEGELRIGAYRAYLDDYERNLLIQERATLSSTTPRAQAIDSLLAPQGFVRLHTWQEWSLPLRFEEKITLVPRAGLGYTHYASFQDNTRDFGRLHLYGGIDISTRFVRRYEGLRYPQLGLDGLLHIIEPYGNFSQLASDDPKTGFRGISILSPTTRPSPLQPARFAALDDLASWSIFRLGVRNYLLTKRDNNSHPWLTLNTYVDWYLDAPRGHNYSNLYNELAWNPLPWMALEFESQLPLHHSEDNFSDFSGNLRLMLSRRLEVEVGYRHLDNHPILENSDRINLRAYYRFSDRWGARLFHRWELADNTLEIQQYQIYRDFESWTAALGVVIRDEREHDLEYGIMLHFTLKAFPSLIVPLAADTQ